MMPHGKNKCGWARWTASALVVMAMRIRGRNFASVRTKTPYTNDMRLAHKNLT
jgi:hypothetical protein